MALTLSKKKEVAKDLNAALDGAKSVVFVRFHKLPSGETINLRKQLREANVGYKVAKKTLIKRVLDDKKFEGEMPDLLGETAIAYGEDLLAPARGVYDFSKTHKDNIQIMGGVFDGVFKSGSEMLAIASIPPMQDLRGMFANIINSPLARFAVLINEYAKIK